VNRETIVDAPGLVLWYYADMGIIHHEMRKYPGAEALQSALLEGLKVMRSRGASKWLSDDRRGGALPKSHHEWGHDVWGPQARAAGWKVWALLPPAEALGSANMSRLVETYGALGVRVQTFSLPNVAMDWLVACK
jgi:hypothetical protein